MRIVLQVVSEASVDISNVRESDIKRGYLLLVGFTTGDNADIVHKMVDKVCKLRVFPDASGKTNQSLADVDGNILAVSQFTLYASVKEGNRPSFTYCLPKEEAVTLYDEFVLYLKQKLPSARFGVFHADMQVRLCNEGPFTLILDSKELFA